MERRKRLHIDAAIPRCISMYMKQRQFLPGDTTSNARSPFSFIWRVFGIRHAALFWLLAGLLVPAMPAQAQPTVVSVVPANDATEVPGDAPVVFTFSINMNTTLTFAYFFSDSGVVTTTATWSADGKRMTNTPLSSFPGSSTITWMVTGQSAAGVTLGGTTFGSFTTGSGGPIIVSVSPATGSTNVSLTAPVVFTFSTNMNTTACLAMFFDDMGSPVAVTASWNAAGTQLTNTPTPPFTANTYILWLVSGEDVLGRELGGTVNGTFQTSAGDSTTPTLVSNSPTNNAAGVLTNLPVLFKFNVPMDTNLTVAQFHEASVPSQLLSVTPSWSEDQTMLWCSPNPAFPAGKVIVWNLQGQAAAGEAFAGATGSFTTAGGGNEPITFSVLLSRGERTEQVNTNLFEFAGQEFRAVAGDVTLCSLVVATPAHATNTLSVTDTPGVMEFIDRDTEATSFATNYPAGDYHFFVNATGTASAATLGLSDGLLPAAPRLLNWQDPPRTALAQPLSLQWNWNTGGAAVDYVRLSIEQDGRIVFATPPPDRDGALNAASNSVVVPAGVFTNAGSAEVSISTFSYTGLDTNSIAGVTVHAARHRTTTFELAVVDGTTPPPFLRTTNLVGVPVGEAVMYPLRTTNGAGAKQFSKIGGSLPAGLTLGSDGTLEGQASSAGTFNATLRLTDLLGQTTTQSLQVVTMEFQSPVSPWLENVAVGNGNTVRFDLVGGAGADCQVERSTNLLTWTPYLTTNPPTDQLTLQVPVDSRTAFFRARGSGSPPPTSNPLTVAPVLNSNLIASAEIDVFGGTLRLTNSAGYVFTLNVPPGALDWPETITMTDIAQIGGLPLSGGLQAAVDLQPEGLMFNLPARLDIQYPGPINTNAVTAFGALSGGKEFALDYSTISNQTVSLDLLHFTMAGAGSGTGSGAQNVPSDPMAAARQEINQARQECLADPECSLDSHNEKLLKLFIQYADQTVIPKLKQAGQNASDGVLDDALYTWLEWCRQLQLLGLAGNLDGADQSGSELGKRMIRATGLASQAVFNGITKACQDCLEHDIWRTRRMFDLARMAELLGWNYSQKAFDCAQKCLVFELKIESEIEAKNSKGTFKAHTKAIAKLKPIQEDGDGGFWAQVVLRMFKGTGKWNISWVEDKADCAITSAPSQGKIVTPMVRIHLYKERRSWIPGTGELISYVFDPDLEVMLSASESLMPDEGRVAHCPKAEPQSLAGFFGPLFLGLHASEYVSPRPGSLDAELWGGPVLRMKGFQQSGAGNVIFSKAYFNSGTDGETVVNENTLVELRHTPK